MPPKFYTNEFVRKTSTTATLKSTSDSKVLTRKKVCLIYVAAHLETMQKKERRQCVLSHSYDLLIKLTGQKRYQSNPFLRHNFIHVVFSLLIVVPQFQIVMPKHKRQIGNSSFIPQNAFRQQYPPRSNSIQLHQMRLEA